MCLFLYCFFFFVFVTLCDGYLVFVRATLTKTKSVIKMFVTFGELSRSLRGVARKATLRRWLSTCTCR